jgi:hypothetical protein
VAARGSDAIAHLVAMSMDPWGWPVGLFVTNRWMTDETWYSGEDLVALLPQFTIDHAFPSWAANRALTALVTLFRPQIEQLLLHRDARVALWAKVHLDSDVFEDRNLETLASIGIDTERQIATIRTEAVRRRCALAREIVRVGPLEADYGLHDRHASRVESTGFARHAGRRWPCRKARS